MFSLVCALSLQMKDVSFIIDIPLFQVLTTESKAALIHKSSVNCSNQEMIFPSPLFVFGEKVCTIYLKALGKELEV